MNLLETHLIAPVMRLSALSAWWLLIGAAAVMYAIVLISILGWVDDPDYTDHDAPPAPTAEGESTP